MMTKKDYDLIAETIRLNLYNCINRQERDVLYAFRLDLILRLEEKNKNFDREKFIERSSIK